MKLLSTIFALLLFAAFADAQCPGGCGPECGCNLGEVCSCAAEEEVVYIPRAVVVKRVSELDKRGYPQTVAEVREQLRRSSQNDNDLLPVDTMFWKWSDKAVQ